MTHPALPRRGELGLPMLSGALLALSFPPLHLLAPPLLALIPWLLFLASRPADRAGGVSTVRATFWMGILYYGVVLSWLFTALVFYTWLAALGYLIAIVVLSALLAAGGYAIHRLRSRHGLPFWAAAPVLWTTVEWLRGHLGDLAFPWLGLGHALTGYPVLVGFADVTGALGVTFWLVAINGILAEWWLAERRRARVWPAALIATLALPIGYSVVRWSTLETRPAARVMVAQPNIPEDLKLEREAAQDSSRTALSNLTEAGFADAAGHVDLVVWPETALPNFIQRASGWRTWTSRLARSRGTAILFGALDYEAYEEGAYDYYNAALLVGPDGDPAGVYRKHYLVPVVERVPFVPTGWIRAVRRSGQGFHVPLIGDLSAYLQYFGGFGRGRSASTFTVDDARFGTLICYESIFPSLSRRYRREGAEFLVNITNDAWFGRATPWWSRTPALWQHPAHLVMRAIENRMGVARAANTGISLFVDPRGRVREATPLFEAAVRTRVVETTDELTPYSRTGDWLGPAAALGSLALLAASLWRERSRRRRVLA